MHTHTWKAAEHGVSVVSSIEHLERVPVLFRDKADYLDLRQIEKGNERERHGSSRVESFVSEERSKTRIGFEISEGANMTLKCPCDLIKIKESSNIFNPSFGTYAESWECVPNVSHI